MWDFEITNIAGIQAAEVTVADGFNVVQASNFMGKSSFMSAIQTVMGTSDLYGRSHPLTEGADEASVSLETAADAYEVRLNRTASGTVTRQGTPVLDDETDRVCGRLFAFLGETNPIRAAVRNSDDLTPLLQAPLDIEAIDEQIVRLKQQRKATARTLQDAEQAAANIPSVTEAITTLESELAALRAQREELAERATAERSTDTTTSDEIADCRSRLQTAEQTITRVENRIQRTTDQLETNRQELAEITVPDEPAVSADIADREATVETLDLQIDLLEGLHRANQRVLEEDEIPLVSSVERGLVDDEIGCWICGESTTRDRIETELEAMTDRLQSLREERAALREEIQTIESTKEEIETQQRRKAALEERIGSLTATRDELETDRKQAVERKRQVADELDALRDRIVKEENTVTEELTDTKAEIRTLETELSEQRSRLETLEEQQRSADELADKTEALESEIDDLRSRKTDTQWELKEQFDSAMADAIDRFAPGFDGARLTVKTNDQNHIEAFELHIARDGRETEIDNLSEGEQELVGITVALAGYRTFDVAERVPLVFLDGISQLSVKNLRLLTEYLADTTQMLVTTAYPEAGEFGGHRISPEQWQTVSDSEQSRA